MPISFVPDAGDVLTCDFTGFQPPEMTKIRRVVVLSPRSRVRFPNTYLVVPISKTPPATAEDGHCEFRPRSYFFFDQVEAVWAKTDMLSCVANHRLNRIRLNGRSVRGQVRKEDLHRIRRAVLSALGMSDWRQVETTARVAEAIVPAPQNGE